MKTRRTFSLERAILVLCVLMLAGCEVPTDFGTSGRARTVALGDIFVIDEGATVRLGRDGPLLFFEAVSEDSRCPADVVCVWAGRARSDFRLEQDDGDATFTLSIPGLVETPYESSEAVTAFDLDFKLLELSPYPSTIVTDSPPYRALLHVDAD